MTKNANSQEVFIDSYNTTSYLEHDVDSDFLEWYIVEGSNRINELSRQLRSFLNYKSNITLLRFSIFKMDYRTLKKDSISKRVEDLISLFTRYSKTLVMIGIEYESIAEKTRNLLQKIKIQPNNHEISLMKEIKHLESEIWKNLHILSESELNYHPQELHTAIKLACILSSVEGVFYPLFSDFYTELKLDYLKLEKEITELLQLNSTEQSKDIEIKKRMGILE